MPQFNTSRHVNHSAENMYNLVADIEKYPQFVPLCDDLKIKSTETADTCDIIHADMTVAYKLLRETFTSKVMLDQTEMKIITEAVEGPFRKMQNIWCFKSTGENSCEVEFSISYEFKTFALQLLVGGLFEKVFKKFSNAFETRADAVYGVKSGSK